MTITEVRRLELRTGKATDRMITEAAELLHVTKSASVPMLLAGRLKRNRTRERDVDVGGCVRCD